MHGVDDISARHTSTAGGLVLVSSVIGFASVKTSNDIMRRVREEARRRAVRWTNQRQAIVETFIAADEHITVEDLHHRVRLIDRTVSAATVYRTVNMLVEMGVATKRHFGTGSATFECEVNKEHHDHFVCTACAKIIEFHNVAIEELQETVAREHGFTLSHHRMELYGVCAECQKPTEPTSIKA